MKPMKNLTELKFFAGHPHPCGYLDNKESVSAFLDPNTPVDKSLYSALADLGFRRSGEHIYKPHCHNCTACIPIRLPVTEFLPNRSQKRCLKRNNDLSASIIDNIDTEEHYALYENYISQRHSDGDMYPPSKETYLSFLSKQWGIKKYTEFRNNDELIAVSVIDELNNGLSATYAFFSPNEGKRGLGQFNVLFLIDLAKKMGLSFMYLGYWIKECQKMNYKINYKPFELLLGNEWILCDKD